MQVVNFQCGHCGKLMGVGSEYLGQQVRCPHCRQVVVAPPPAPANLTLAEAPSEALFQPGTAETIARAPAAADNHDDIFSPPEASDDLFGRTEAPRIEIPPDSLAPTMAGENAAPPQPALEPTVTTTVPYMPSEAVPSGPINGEGTAVLPSGGEAPWMAATVTEMAPSSAPEAPASGHEELLGGPSTPSAARPARRSESGTPWFMILVFSPLLLYAIVITVFAVMLYQQEREVEQKLRKHFDVMPDEGDNPGVHKGKKVTQFKHFPYKPEVATMPLPDNLITALDKKGGETIRVGELQITPKSVQRQRVSVFVENYEKSEPCTGDSLVLKLMLKNLSTEYAFAPLDNYFDRYWKPGMDQLPPFTQLEAGNKARFYGGPAEWFPRGTKDKRRQWVEGHKAFEAELLQPGEEKEFFVCTDGSDPKALLTLFGENKGEKVREPYHGSFLWRVRVRRGLVNVLGKELPATAVVGVKFTDKDIVH